MIDSGKVLAIITARGGSKGVKQKNIREVFGKPLIAYTIEAAQKSAYIDRLILSSEDPQIIEVSKKLGCDVPFVRPTELAQDASSSEAVIVHALESLPGYDYVVLLQPTSPLRNTHDIDACIELCQKNQGYPSVSVCLSDKSPFWTYFLDGQGQISSVMGQADQTYFQRQQVPQTYALNGAVYVSKVALYMKNKAFITPQTVAHVMPKERSVDIDTEIDLKLFEFLIKEQNCHAT